MCEDLIKQARELCDGAKTENDYSEPVYGSDTYRLAMECAPQLCDVLEAAQKENEHLQGKLQDQEYQISLDAMAQSRDEAIARAEKAEAQRDAYRKALSHLEHMVSHERSRGGKREHSVGVAVAIGRARKLLKGE
jgi:hypothetical protein